MLKITGGKFKARNIQSLKGLETRPTASRIRQSIFDVLINSNKGFPLINSARVLDLYAGTGIMGLEAISRGAEKVVFVDSSRKAAQLIRRNVQTLQIDECCRIFAFNVSKAIRILEQKGDVFDFVFLDPPYAALEERKFAVRQLAGASLLRPGACLIVEGPVRKTWSEEGFSEETLIGKIKEVCFRRWGDSEVRFLSYV